MPLEMPSAQLGRPGTADEAEVNEVRCGKEQKRFPQLRAQGRLWNTPHLSVEYKFPRETHLENSQWEGVKPEVKGERL